MSLEHKTKLIFLLRRSLLSMDLLHSLLKGTNIKEHRPIGFSLFFIRISLIIAQPIFDYKIVYHFCHGSIQHLISYH